MQPSEEVRRESELGVPASALREKPTIDAIRVSVSTILPSSDAAESSHPLIGSHFFLTSGRLIGSAGAALFWGRHLACVFALQAMCLCKARNSRVEKQ